MISRSIRRRQFMRLCAGSLTAAALGCSRTRDQTRTRPSTLTILTEQDEWDLGPGQDDPPKLLVFLQLVTRNAHGEIEGRLAEAWEHSPDYRTWIVHLRPGVRWHDGTPVTAHDVKFTLDLYMHPAVLWVPPGSYVVSVLDDKTYTITYHRRVMGMGIPAEDDYTVYYPKHLLEKLDPNEFYAWEFWTHPVGNGPYRYVRHVPKTMMELEANPDYYRGQPRVEKVLLKFGNPTASGAVTELLSSDVDVARLINPVDALKLKGDPRFRVYEGIYREQDLWVVALFWNQRHPVLGDPRVRRALTLAINRRELDQLLNLPSDTPIFDVIFTQRQLRRGDLPQPLPYDPELAKALLEEAGLRDQKGEGRRQPDGRPFRFAVLAPDYGPDAQAAVYVEAALRRVGVQANLLTLDWDTVRQRSRAGNFEAAILEMTLGECRMFFGELEIGDVGTGFALGRARNSPIGYTDPKLTALFKELRVTFNPDQEDRIYHQIWPILQADMPVTFLCPFVQPTAARRQVHGLSSPWRTDPVWYMEDIWLEERGRG